MPKAFRQSPTQKTKASTCKQAEPAGRPAFTLSEVPRGGETDLSRPTSGQAARGAGKPAWELILSSCPARQPRERLNTGESPADSCPSRMFSATWESNLSATHRRLTCACASTNTEVCTDSCMLHGPGLGRTPRAAQNSDKLASAPQTRDRIDLGGIARKIFERNDCSVRRARSTKIRGSGRVREIWT